MICFAGLYVPAWMIMTQDKTEGVMISGYKENLRSGNERFQTDSIEKREHLSHILINFA
jgi:hypothetical protein